MHLSLNEIVEELVKMPPEASRAITTEALEATKDEIWVPNPGPQLEAYESLADEIGFGGEAGGGKALSADTPIPTPHGWTTMGDVAQGDQLLDEHGRACTVVAVSSVMVGHPCYRVTFSDGAEIVADGDHRWLTSNHRERDRALRCSEGWRAKRRVSRPSRGTGKRPDLARRNTETRRSLGLPLFGVRTTAEILNTLRIGHDNRINHSVVLAAPLQLPQRPLLIDAYVLGAWLGDGTSMSASITNIDEEVFLQVANAGYTISRRPSGPITPGILGLQAQLRALGLLGNKHIPPAYLRASIDQRLALLQGLMDTDGYCDETGRCEFTTTKRVLAEHTSELLCTLGIKNAVAQSQAKLNGRVVGPKFRILFLTHLPAFRLSRKLIRQKRSGFRGTHDVRYITSVQGTPSVPVKCVAVDSASRLYLAGRQMVPTHNSDLGIGLSLTAHRRSLLVRRTNKEANKFVDRYEEILGSREGWNSQRGEWRLPGRLIEIGGCQLEQDKQKYKGHPRDLVFVDQVEDFTESQYTFIIGWNRSTDLNQRCRVVATFNPPTRPEGFWVLKRWAPWLDPRHPHPALSAELRWFTTIEGKDTEVEGPGPHIINGEPVMAKSRTFIRSQLEDNPDLAQTNYGATLAALPDELRSAYKEGNFEASLRDAPFQVVPTDWVRLAQMRWSVHPPAGVPMCAIAIDASGGGEDPMTIGWRHDGWFSPIEEIPGRTLPMDKLGRWTAGLVFAYRRDKAVVIIDVGGGYGLSAYEHIKDQGEMTVIGFKGAEGSVRRTHDHQLCFANRRTEALWRFREALDPGQAGGSMIMLPDSPQLVADLTAPTYEVRGSTIHVEPKEDVCERLGRSTDFGDNVMMCWSAGPVMATHGTLWEKEYGRRRTGREQHPVVMGRHNARRSR